MNNPYEAPKSPSTEATDGELNPSRLGIFMVNFVVSACFILACLIAVFAPDTTLTFFGSLIAIIPFGIYALCEWIAGYYKNFSMERGLGWVNLVSAGFVAFGVVTNLGEALLCRMNTDPTFLFWFALMGTLVVAYLASAGWMRLRWTRSH